MFLIIIVMIIINMNIIIIIIVIYLYEYHTEKGRETRAKRLESLLLCILDINDNLLSCTYKII